MVKILHATYLIVPLLAESTKRQIFMKMKTKFYLIATAVAAMAMTSCSEDKDLYNPEQNDKLRNEAYAKAFEEQFGKIPADQTWDFYASLFNGTRATRAGEINVTPIEQPEGMDFSEWGNMLKKQVDNRNVGTRDFSLVSNGKFKMYAVWYSGDYEAYSQYHFELGAYIDGEFHKIFDSMGKERVQGVDFQGENPGFGALVDIPKGQAFQLYIKYSANSHPYTAFSGRGESSTEPGAAWTPINSYGNAALLYSNNIAEDNEKVMVIGFEDKMRLDWTPNGKEIPDCNDVMLYIEGDPELPIPEAKRFFCEDQSNIGDFDFNDVVFDIRPAFGNKAEVTLLTAGGKLPIELVVGNTNLGEVHSLLGVGTDIIANTGYTKAEPYKTLVEVPADFDLTKYDEVKLLVTAEDGSKYEVNYSDAGEAPSFIATPVGTKWMQEKKNIKLGYPSFFSNNWFENPVNDHLYTAE